MDKRQDGKTPGAGRGYPHFPLFVSLEGKRVVIVGNGAIARRRAATLLPFGCRVVLIAPEGQELEGAQWLRRPYEPGDCRGADLVVAATNRLEVNRQVEQECRELGVPVNRADCKEACDFYFPAVIRQGDVVIGVTASGASHRLNRQVAENIRQRVGEIIPEEEL